MIEIIIRRGLALRTVIISTAGFADARPKSVLIITQK
jgi:hypothetical protein